jgi:hypothetical protein
MDLHDKDDSKLRRQETLARRVGQALDQMDARNAAHCPDGEILATHAEGGLSQADAEKWESHFATCSRCRKILQVLAVSADTPLAEKEVAHLGELIAGARVPAQMGVLREAGGRTAPVIPIWRRSWVAPAIGIAAVLVVWLVMRPPWRSVPQRPPENLIAQAPKEELPPSPAPQEVAPPSRESPPQDQKTELETELTAPAKKSEASPSDAERSLAEALPQKAPAAPPAGLRDKGEDNRLSEQAQARAKAQPQVAAASPAPAGAAISSTMADTVVPAAPAPSPAAPPTVSQTVTVTEAAPPVQKASGAASNSVQAETRPNAPVNGRAFAAFAQLQGSSGNAVLLNAPNSSVAWRAGKGGSIERSTDGGKTWAAQTSPSQQDWLAGAVFSDKVCWLAGRKGAIARTVDGERWDLISPPAQAAAAGGAQPDWTGMTALDALNATVTAADGRKFNTPDGGLSWQPE